MFRNSNVLFPTDFSQYALYAMKYAVAIARKYQGVVHVAHVLDASLFTFGGGLGFWRTKTDADSLADSMHEQAEAKLAEMTQRIQDAGARVEQHNVQGRPWNEIIRLAEDLDCGVIVIATHGRTGFDHLTHGSVAERVVRHSRVPVLCIKNPEHEFVDDGDLSIHITRVLFPTDFSGYTEKALGYATSICTEFGASLTLFHSSELPAVLPEFMPDTAATVGADMVDNARESLERMRQQVSDVQTEAIVRSGIAYREICRIVDEKDINLVVLPTHGKTGLSHALFGSVAEKVVRLSHCPVLTIRPESETE